jgi:hypothetical protein
MTHIAEQFLGWFTGRDRAASIVGDLLEAHRPQSIAFWWAVLRTASSFLRDDLMAEPLFLTGLAFRAWLLQLGVIHPLVVPSHLNGAFRVLIATIFKYQVGRWLGRRARGREVASCIIFEISVMFIDNALNRGAPGLAAYLTIDFAAMASQELAFALPMFAGAIRARAKSSPSLVA